MENPKESTSADEKSLLIREGRSARIATHGGDCVGICLFVSAVDLQEFDLEPAEIDRVQYQIADVHGKRYISLIDPQEGDLNVTSDQSPHDYLPENQ